MALKCCEAETNGEVGEIMGPDLRASARLGQHRAHQRALSTEVVGSIRLPCWKTPWASIMHFDANLFLEGICTTQVPCVSQVYIS